ncbi:MAG: hypothetical protein B7Z07_03580 [Sphingomonadales bacterium 32-67-7]|nr:MAG: hypothetical protein B7Z07_03580 [Sphingomonadales bacterium 32-67-7]
MATLGYGHSTFDRNLYRLGLNLATSAGFDGTVLGGRIEAGYTLPIPGTVASLTPFLAFQPMQLWQGAATESFGTLGNGLTYDATSITALPTYLGLQLDGTVAGPGGLKMATFLRAAWMHDFSPDREVPRSFAELPNWSFASTPLATVTDAADLQAGLRFSTSPNLSFAATLDAQLAPGYSTVGASATLRVTW